MMMMREPRTNRKASRGVQPCTARAGMGLATSMSALISAFCSVRCLSLSALFISRGGRASVDSSSESDMLRVARFARSFHWKEGVGTGMVGSGAASCARRVESFSKIVIQFLNSYPRGFEGCALKSVPKFVNLWLRLLPRNPSDLVNQPLKNRFNDLGSMTIKPHPRFRSGKSHGSMLTFEKSTRCRLSQKLFAHLCPKIVD